MVPLVNSSTNVPDPPVTAVISAVLTPSCLLMSPASSRTSSVVDGPATTTRHGAGEGALSSCVILWSWSASQITSLASLARSLWVIAGGAKAVNNGTWIAPRRQIPRSATTSSADLPINVATWSPGPMPSSDSAAANFVDCSRS